MHSRVWASVLLVLSVLACFARPLGWAAVYGPGDRNHRPFSLPGFVLTVVLLHVVSTTLYHVAMRAASPGPSHRVFLRRFLWSEIAIYVVVGVPALAALIGDVASASYVGPNDTMVFRPEFCFGLLPFNASLAAPLVLLSVSKLFRARLDADRTGQDSR